MTTFIFRCPNVGLRVHGWTAEDVSDDQVYEGVVCTACCQLHLVSPATGKVLGEGDDE
jgi:hypothetical protein